MLDLIISWTTVLLPAAVLFVVVVVAVVVVDDVASYLRLVEVTGADVMLAVIVCCVVVPDIFKLEILLQLLLSALKWVGISYYLFKKTKINRGLK